MSDERNRGHGYLADILEAAASLQRNLNVGSRQVTGRDNTGRDNTGHGDHGSGHHDTSLPSILPERLREALNGLVQSLGRSLAPVLKGLGDYGLGRDPSESKPPRVGAFLERSFSNPAGSRDYKLFVPARVVALPPLVVMLHGCGQSPDDFASATAMNALAEAQGFLVAYPGQSRRAHGQKCWNWYLPADQERGSGEAAIIAGITQAITAEYAVDPQRVYIAGLSAGAAAAANVARAYPDIYAALGMHSGLAAGCARDVTSALTAMRLGALAANGLSLPAADLRLPTIMFQGENDSTVNPRNGEQILAQAGVAALTPMVADGVSPGGLPYTRTRYADGSGQVVVESWMVRGLAHAWSGGHRAGSHTDHRGPDASQALMSFFLEHRLDSVRH